MRESVLKEADQFNREGECYIHVEKTQDGFFRVIVAGDPVMILQGVFNVLSRLEVIAGLPVKETLKMLMKGYKKVGIHHPFLVDKNEDREAC